MKLQKRNLDRNLEFATAATAIALLTTPAGRSDKCQDFHMIYEKNKKLRSTRYPKGGRLTGYMINECCITGALITYACTLRKRKKNQFLTDRGLH